MPDMNTDTANVDPTPSWAPENDPDGYTFDDVQPKDFYLETVLNFVHGLSDEHQGAVGLTVTSNGALVSGLAISRAEWIAGVVEQYKQAGAGETAHYIESLFSEHHGDIVAEKARRSDADLPTRARGYLHMKDARIGTGTSYTEVGLWRGNLVDITGWSLGSWNPQQSRGAQ